jgi:hypothetical protein
MHNGSVYATGKHMNGTVSTALLNGLIAGTGRTGVFTTQFTPTGTLISNSVATPLNSGLNEGTDISALDAILINTGFVVFAATPATFVTSNDFAVQSFTSDAFIGRIDEVTNAYFKKGNTKNHQVETPPLVHVYPNPSAGDFILEFNEEWTGLLTMTNAHGQIIEIRMLDKAGFARIGHDAMPPGIYFLSIQSELIQRQFSLVVAR